MTHKHHNKNITSRHIRRGGCQQLITFSCMCPADWMFMPEYAEPVFHLFCFGSSMLYVFHWYGIQVGHIWDIGGKEVGHTWDIYGKKYLHTAFLLPPSILLINLCYEIVFPESFLTIVVFFAVCVF